jgi:Ca2+-binding EF-hand superfamily protein
MKFPTIVLAISGLLYTCHASAQADDQVANKPTPEAAIKAEIDATFTKVDTNKNGTISREEFSAYMEEAIAAQVKIFNQTFDTLDTNKDGKISREEAAENKAFAAGFDDVDTNKDGFISKEELATAIKAAQEQKADR